MCMNNEVDIEPSKEWSNDRWMENQEERTFIKNKGMKVLNSGTAKGKIIGGNLCTLNLLQGTEYMPELENSILFIEDDGETGKYFNKEFDRNLQSLLHSAKGKKFRGLVIGRAENLSEMNYDKWKEIIDSLLQIDYNKRMDINKLYNILEEEKINILGNQINNLNIINQNIIIGEIYINKDNVDKNIQIINSYENCKRIENL